MSLLPPLYLRWIDLVASQLNSKICLIGSALTYILYDGPHLLVLDIFFESPFADLSIKLSPPKGRISIL
jgi:hypothetical protein